MALAGRLDNIDVLCTDLDAMVAFYRDVLEVPLLFPYDPESGWAGFQAGDVTIYFITVEGAAPPLRRIPGAGPAGFESFAFAVDDLDAAIAELSGRGVQWAGEIVESDWYRYRGFYDPEGNLLYVTVPDRDALGLAAR
jgi:catechol 2,3-dioxygenase-like lactoylglutathione lyase family enzyme